MLYDNEKEMQLAVAALAHQIKGPLAVIRADINLLETELKDKKRFKVIYSQLDKINKIVVRFMEFSRPFEYNPETFDFFAAVKSSVEGRALLAKAKRICFEFNCNDKAFVFADKDKIAEGLANILQNAVEAVEDDCGLVKVSAYIKDKNALAVIEDNGLEIKDETLKMLGTPFYTTKKSGSGMGIYTAKRVFCDSSGDFNIQSLPGKGVKVILSLPLAKEKDV